MATPLSSMNLNPGHYFSGLHSDTRQATFEDSNSLIARIAQLEQEICEMIPQHVGYLEVASWNDAGLLLDSRNNEIGRIADIQKFQTKVRELRQLDRKLQEATNPFFQSFKPPSNLSDMPRSLLGSNNVNPERGFQPSQTASNPSGLGGLSSLRNSLSQDPHNVSRGPIGKSPGTRECETDLFSHSFASTSTDSKTSSTATQPSQSPRTLETPANTDTRNQEPTSAAHSSAIDYDDLKNTQFLKEKLKQLKQEKEETEKFITDLKSERNGKVASLLVRLHTFGSSNGNEEVDEAIAKLSQKISPLEDDINDINDMLTKNTKEKAQRVAVLVLQQECIDVENTIKDKNITIGGTPLKLDVKSYFTLRELKEGKKNKTALEAKKTELEAHHKYLTQRLEAIKLLSS